MKTWKLALAVGLLGLGSLAHAGLIDRGNGLIYDDVLDITWMQEANFCGTNPTDPGCILAGADATNGRMTWDEAVSWADNLVYAGYDDWRLPTLGPINGTAFQTVFSNNATTDSGYAKTTTGADDGGWRDGAGDPVSEMGHMYYVNLANLGFCTPNDGDPGSCSAQTGWGLNNVSFVDAITGQTVDFLHVQPRFYWSGLEFAPSPSLAWDFDFGDGGQGADDKSIEFYAWAVRPGDVAAAPVPGTAVLMALGLVGLGAGRRLRRAT